MIPCIRLKTHSIAEILHGMDVNFFSRLGSMDLMFAHGPQISMTSIVLHCFKVDMQNPLFKHLQQNYDMAFFTLREFECILRTSYLLQSSSPFTGPLHGPTL